MATIKYKLKSNKNKAVSIYVRLSIGRGKEFEVSTGFSTHPKEWSLKTGEPKQVNKQLRVDLKKLETYILKQLNLDNTTSTLIDSRWLKNKIAECFQRVEKTNDGLLLNHIQKVIDTAYIRKLKNGGIGVSQNRKKRYITFKNLIERYQDKINHEINFLEIDKRFEAEYIDWLIECKEYSVNYAGKNIADLGFFCRDAESLGILVHPYSLKIKGFKEKSNDRHIVTLSPEELLRIYNTKIDNPALDNAKKWILIGCNIGQRGEDLLKIKTTDFKYVGENIFIDVKQQKTEKSITAPITEGYVKDIIENSMPYPLRLNKLNKHIKKVCELAGINQMTKSKKFDAESKRKILNKYPKFELITSHSFRRSFATNYYKKVPTPIIMKITGHSKESTFLEYINQRVDKDEDAMLFLKFVNESKKEKTSVMQVIKQA